MNRMSSIIAVLIAVLSPAARAADTFVIARISTPLVVSAAGGLRLGADPSAMRPCLQAEAGVGGGQLSIGLDKTGIADFGYAIKAAILRTWIEPIEVDDNQTFIGLVGEVSIKRMVLSAGGYHRVSDGDDDWLASAGIGFFF